MMRIKRWAWKHERFSFVVKEWWWSSDESEGFSFFSHFVGLMRIKRWAWNLLGFFCCFIQCFIKQLLVALRCLFQKIVTTFIEFVSFFKSCYQVEVLLLSPDAAFLVFSFFLIVKIRFRSTLFLLCFNRSRETKKLGKHEVFF